MTSLLNIIDNPIQDIPLISVLLSPIGNFKIDDLAFIRAQKIDSALYFALLEFSEKNERLELKREQTERNLRVFKNRLRAIVEQQLEVVDEIETLEIEE